MMRDEEWIALQLAEAEVVDRRRRSIARRLHLGRVLFRGVRSNRLADSAQRRSTCTDNAQP